MSVRPSTYALNGRRLRGEVLRAARDYYPCRVGDLPNAYACQTLFCETQNIDTVDNRELS